MIQALHTSSTALSAQTTALDTTANNLANVNTTGFKRSRVEFQDLMSQTAREAGTFGAAGQSIPTGTQIGMGVRVSGTSKNFSQGGLEQTGGQFDLAIEGDGFFTVRQPNGETAYTRDGSFGVNGLGQLVTADGFVLQPPITLPADVVSVNVGQDGIVTAVTAGSNQLQTLGQIQLTRFANPAGLSAEGNNLFLPTAASGAALSGVPGTPGFGAIQQGFLERSNVNVVSEFVSLITAQRAFESSSRVVRVSDEMWQSANDLIR